MQLTMASPFKSILYSVLLLTPSNWLPLQAKAFLRILSRVLYARRLKDNFPDALAQFYMITSLPDLRSSEISESQPTINVRSG